ncbi:MAG: DNA mismatch repair protein MutS [Clostridia bacterium]|nr:DNA mismatch repair protein MutS [Clostridia bacterium]
MAKTDGPSPMMEHYRKTKQKYQDAILFYRLGDFYEMFDDDAIKASRILDLTLTGKECGNGERAPMCGVPYHAADNYIAKLVSFGEKVAICEQLEDAVKGKLVQRDVIKVISAGTVTENNMLDEKQNNYILSVGEVDGIYAICWADITTGDFYAQNVNDDGSLLEVISAIQRVNPVEIISYNSICQKANNTMAVKRSQIVRFSTYNDWEYSVSRAYKALTAQFGVHNLAGFGLEDNKSIISCAGALISYLNETQKRSINNLNTIEIVESGEYMYLNESAVKNLELVKNMRDGKRYGSLQWVIDKTRTAMGSRRLNNWLLSPLQDVSSIEYRQNGVNELYCDALMRNAVKDLLSSVKDTERLSGKISNNNITPRDCLQLSSSLSVFPSIIFTLAGTSSKILNDIKDNIYDFTDLTNLISHAISPNAPLNLKDGGYIAEGFDKELDRLREISDNSNKILLEMEEREKEETGIKTLKIRFNKVFGYYIEVSNSFKDKVPYHYIRKQTLTTGERFITEELKNLEEEILTSKQTCLKIESEIFAKIKSVLDDNLLKIKRSSKAVATLDVLLSFATVAKANNYCMPTITNENELNLIQSRHPVVEEILDNQFIPNDCYMNDKTDNMLIITGPNMAGKSTYMRQIALITILAHIGSFVPCKSAIIPLTDKIFTRVGASDNLISDQSTFMVEMNEVAVILNKATENSLLILDEVGRGTSTFDGLSIAWAVIEYIVKKIGAKTLFATHYHELSELEGKLDGVKNYKICVKEDNGNIIFLRKIKEGSANKSFGIEVASLAGVPKEVTLNARTILKKLEQNDIGKSTKIETVEVVNNVENQLKDVILAEDFDNYSPRQALEFLYKLKEIAKE